MTDNKSEDLSKLVEILDEIKSRSADTDKIDYIINYLHDLTSVLVEYETIIKSLVTNQNLSTKFTTTTNDSIGKIVDRFESIENHLESHDKHLDAHDQNLEIYSKHLETHDKYLDLLSKQLDF